MWRTVNGCDGGDETMAGKHMTSGRVNDVMSATETMKKRTVVVTGANGQLGQELVKQLAQHYVVHGFARETLDVTDVEHVRSLVHTIRPDVIVHTAAYTAVDRAEDEREEAERVNVQGTANVAKVAQEVDAICCYMSTDYVFDGRAGQAYKEGDQAHPINYYGVTKFTGEQIVRAVCRKYFVIRTSWLYGLAGSNFVLKMLERAVEGEKIQVVDDQVGCPTFVPDLVRFMAALIATDRYGVYHASNAGACSWYEFACSIFALSEELEAERLRAQKDVTDAEKGDDGRIAGELGGGQTDGVQGEELAKEGQVEGGRLDGGRLSRDKGLINDERWRAVQVVPCSSAHYPSKAPRPAYSVLDNEAMREAGFVPMRHWREALRAFLVELSDAKILP